MTATERAEERKLNNEAAVVFIGWLEYEDKHDCGGSTLVRVEVKYRKHEEEPLRAGYFRVKVPSQCLGSPTTLARDRVEKWGKRCAHFRVTDAF